jgi:hypothetical protein
VPDGKRLPVVAVHIDIQEAEPADNKPMVLAANKRLPVIDDDDGDSNRLVLLLKSMSPY